MTEKLIQQRERLSQELDRMRQKCESYREELARNGGPSADEAQLLQRCFAKLETLSGKVQAHGAPAMACAAGTGSASTGSDLPDMAPVDMKDEDIAAEIMDKQSAILEGWLTALLNFDKTLTSSSDADATPDFQKVITGYFAEKLMGALMEHAPGASELDAIGKALTGEVERASAAGASAKLRDFVIQHHKAIGKLKQKVLSERQGFISAVRARREALEGGAGGGSKGKKPNWKVEQTKESDDYGMMRMALLDTLEKVDKTLARSTPEVLFQVLSEQWIKSSKVRGGMGTSFQAVVVIRLNPNYSVKDAHIQGSGGQKLAEQLLT